jgi:hypothetical protein
MTISKRTRASCITILASRILLGCMLITGCHRQTQPAPSLATAKSPRVREYCWWAVLRSARPPDSVAVRFQRAYQELMLGKVTSGRRGDTAWAHAGPSWISNRATNASYESGALAYPIGDSTHFRYYVTISAPPGGWIRQSDSVEASRGDIDFCTNIARHASIGWTAPNNPTGEESLALWALDPWMENSPDSITHR